MSVNAASTPDFEQRRARVAAASRLPLLEKLDICHAAAAAACRDLGRAL